MLGNFAFIVAVCLLVGGLFAGAATIRGEPNGIMVLSSVPVALVGLFLRAASGAWSALERIAAHQKE